MCCFCRQTFVIQCNLRFFHKVMKRHLWGVMENLITALREIYCEVWWWKNLENQSAIGKRKAKSRVASYFLDTVYIHTDSRLMASFPGQPGYAGTREVRPVWILMKQETTGWQCHQLDHTSIICTSLQTDNHASTSSLIFFAGRMLFLAPNKQHC